MTTNGFSRLFSGLWRGIACLLLLSEATWASDLLCPDLSTISPGNCAEVSSWSELLEKIESTIGNELVLCPFSIQREASDEAAVIKRGMAIRCLIYDESDECAIRGKGNHLVVSSSEDTLVQGISFYESDDHAVHVVSDTDGAEKAVHTFCSCSFNLNERLEASRGGAFKTEKNAGTVNVVNCAFSSNYSLTYGAAIYSRTNLLNVIGSSFKKNIAGGWGGAIFVAADGSVTIQSSFFEQNYGRSGYAIVVNPRSGPSVWTDGYENEFIDSDACEGFWNMFERKCEIFVSAPSGSPSFSASIPTSRVPSMAPTGVEETLCSIDSVDTDCINVRTWRDFEKAILGAEGRVVFCGRFRIRKPTREMLVVSTDIEIQCNSLCTIYGRGTQMRVEGEATQVKVHNVKFSNSDASAVQVHTSSTRATTTFCGCEFMNNALPVGLNGAALYISNQAGVVNVVDGYFASNQASLGGAIFSQAYKLNIVGSHFILNKAYGVASAIFSDKHSHILIRTSTFGMNTVVLPSGNMFNYAVTVHPESVAEFDIAGVSVDAGMNVFHESGDCDGVFDLEEGSCEEFDLVDGIPLDYPFIPGDLSVYDEAAGLRLSTGLTARVLAKTGSPINLTSSEARSTHSGIPFLEAPDGAATFPLEDGGWIYMLDSDLQNKKGGSYAVIFDSYGEVRDFEPRLLDTTKNSNGGVTPWGSWISCEEYPNGQCYQVDPLGEREPEVTFLGEAEGGNYEGFTMDYRDPSNPVFFVSEDSMTGTLRSVRPGAGAVAEGWDMLILDDEVVREYLLLDPDSMTFSWTDSIEKGRASAYAYYPNIEGITHHGDGILYMACKTLGTIFALDLDNFTYTASKTSEGNLVGYGQFQQEADQLIQLNDRIMYMTEDGGANPGVYGRDLETGYYFAVFEALSEVFTNDDVTGLALSPDHTRLYACFQTNGIMFEIKRDDGLPF